MSKFVQVVSVVLPQLGIEVRARDFGLQGPGARSPPTTSCGYYNNDRI